MQQAYEGYFENGKFYPSGPPMRIQGRRRVVLTVLDDEVPKETRQAQAWREFFDTVNASDEEIPGTFERVDFTQEVDL